MKRKQTALILILALSLALSLPLSARAASGLSVAYSASGNSVSLSLTGLSGHIYAAELRLTLKGSFSEQDLTFRPAGEHQGLCTATPAGTSTAVTLYLYGDTPLNAGSSLSMGTLNVPSSALPSGAVLKLLDRGLKPVQGANGVTVGVAAGAPVLKPIPFTDVPRGEWYYNAVQYAYSYGLMSGSNPTRFDPGGSTNRAMIVTILYNLEGKPAVNTASAPFTDVPAGEWYAAPVAWASSNGVVAGYGNTFRPLQNITREEMATMLYNYAKYKGYDLSAANSLTGYADAGQISSWALVPLQWANANKLINGYNSTTLGPGNGAIRAEAAAIFMSFCENVRR